MSLVRTPLQQQADLIKNKLFVLLVEVTTPEVLALDKEFSESNDKDGLLAQFEATETSHPTRDPILLERWSHYCWIRLELIYLANQSAVIKQVAKTKKEIDELHRITPLPTIDPLTSKEVQSRFLADGKGMTLDEFKSRLIDPLETKQAFTIPALIDSVDSTIQRAAMKGTSITSSIDVLRKMQLQIIGTEHPTDPLSQKARDTISELALALTKEPFAEQEIKKLLHNLQTTDAIPSSKRSVTQEVERNISITLSPLYDNIPTLVESILNAYKRYYGEEVYLNHEKDILDAIQTLVRNASWPGCDADGNKNVTAATMAASIAIYRAKAAEKHIETLQAKLMKRDTAKNTERELRDTFRQLNLKLYRILLKSTDNIDVLEKVYVAQNEAAGLIINRDFSSLATHYDSLYEFLESFPGIPSTNKLKILNILYQQKSIAQSLDKLTRFCLNYKAKPTDTEYTDGALQQFMKLFVEYQGKVEKDLDAIHFLDEDGKQVNPTQYVVEAFEKLLKEHQEVLELFPELAYQARIFALQLRSFGMTYGYGHIRQDSSVFVKVWDALIEDLKTDPDFREHPIFISFKDRSYSKSSEEVRVEFHKKLLDQSQDSKRLLKGIRLKHEQSKYQGNPKFADVVTELDRLKLAASQDDMFENIIISNCESGANILEVESLLSVFSKRTGKELLTVVPLLEKPEDLARYESILTDYIKYKIQQKLAQDPQADLSELEIEIMVGFSDTERVGGISALIAVQKVQEDFILLCKKFGVKPKIYLGPGADPTRGGLKRRDPKATLQGNGREVLDTPESTQWYRENQFSYAYDLAADPDKKLEFHRLPPALQESLYDCMNKGMNFYKQLQDEKFGLGKLTGLMLGQTCHWMVGGMINSSSRATQRGNGEKGGDRTSTVQTGGLRPDGFIHIDPQRAISLAQMNEILRHNLNFIGSCYGLRAIGEEQIHALYDSSEVFRDMIQKNLLGSATRDLTFLKQALFADYPDLIATSPEQKLRWASICEQNYPRLLQDVDIEAMSKDSSKREGLLVILSRYIAYVEVECEKTTIFMQNLNRKLHGLEHKVKPISTPSDLKQPTDLLFHAPDWQLQASDMVKEVEPLSHLLARQCRHVANGKNLDQVYTGINMQTIANSLLSGIGRLLGNIAAGLTAFRLMPPGFTESMSHDYRPTLREGHARARKEFNKEVGQHNSVFRFFERDEKSMLERTVSKQLESIRMGSVK